MSETMTGIELARPPSLLATKLHPPPRRPQTVVRDRLLERLRLEPGLKLTLVVAPAGAGKTTLLSDWREREAAARPIAWMSLDEGDNDPVVLWSHLIEALRRVCPGLDDLGFPGAVAAGRIVDAVVRRLVNELTEQGEVVLILDDFHRLSGGEARDTVGWLAEHAPSTFQLVLGTRSEPALPLAAMRAHGELLEVRGDALGFTVDEGDTLLNGRLELGLTRDEVQTLVERTEGLPAGIYLAALSLRRVPDRHAFVRSYDGGSRHVVDFLVDEVLDAHDPALQELMLRCSILGRLCGPLCDAVLERDGSAQLLSALARTNLFLVPLDDEGEWYRFHHLFARLLRVELEHRQPGAAQSLHRRAYDWHREHGSVEEAIEHAFEAAAFREAGELVARWHIAYVGLGRRATILGWLQRLPRELVRENARLLLAEAWISADLGLRDDVARAIAALGQVGSLDEGPLPDGFSSLESSLVTLQALHPWGDLGAAYESAMRAVELEGPRSTRRDVACSALGYALYFRGELDAADRWLAEAAVLAPAHGHPTVAAYSLAYRSFIAGEAGRVDDQTELAEAAAGVAAAHGLEDLLGDVSLAVGLSLAARGQMEDALRLVERGVGMMRPRSQPHELVHALIHQARLLSAAGANEGARGVTAEARAIVDSCPDLGVLEARLAELERPPRASPPESEQPTLSARELVVLRLLRGRLSERDIGRELYLSHNTIHSHTRSIYRKLGASSRSEAVQKARELGLI
jgi:LuxR family maltose regulon positive regulatory protein